MTENVFDFETRRKWSSPEKPEKVTISNWFNIWKKYAKDNDTDTIMIVAIGKDGQLHYDIFGMSELQLLKLYRECDNMKAYIDGMLSPDLEIDVDLEDEDET